MIKLNLIIAVTLFCIGFRFHELAIVASMFTTGLIINCYGLSKNAVKMLLAITTFYGLYIIFGLFHTEDSLSKFIFKYLAFYLSSVLLFVVGVTENKKSNELFVYYCFITLVYYYSVVVYSYSLGLEGYGKLLNPIAGIIQNSPLIVMACITAFLGVYEYAKGKDNTILNFICVVLFLINLVSCSFYMESRASLVISCLFIIFGFYKKIGFYSILLSPIIIITFALSTNSLFDLDVINNFGGFEDRGLDSPRFEMLIQGFSEFWMHPFGGMEVQSVNYDGNYFHNMFLDIVRTSGFITAIVWILILLSTYMMIRANENVGKNSYKIMFVTLIIFLCQDLAFDGAYNLICVLFFIIGTNVKMIDEVK